MSDIIRELRNIQTAPSPYKSLGQLCREAANEIERLRAGLDAAIRCSELALFVIRKQGAMPNSSWESGFNSDLAKAKAARSAVVEQQAEGK